MTILHGGFQIASWDENAYDERDGRRLTKASVTQQFEGEVAGRRGTFVLETSGEFDGRVARWEARVVSGSSTGELAALSGGGKFEAPHGSEASYELEVDLP